MVNTKENHDASIIAVASVFQIFMTASFITRIVSVRLRKHRWNWDDLLLLIAFVGLWQRNQRFDICTDDRSVLLVLKS